MYRAYLKYEISLILLFSTFSRSLFRLRIKQRIDFIKNFIFISFAVTFNSSYNILVINAL